MLHLAPRILETNAHRDWGGALMTRAARRPCAAHRDNTARRRYRAACAHGRHENGRARVHVLTDATQ